MANKMTGHKWASHVQWVMSPVQVWFCLYVYSSVSQLCLFHMSQCQVCIFVHISWFLFYFNSLASRVPCFEFPLCLVISAVLSCQVKGSIQVSGYQVLVFCVQLSAVYVFISHPSLLLPFALQYFVQPTIKASTSPLSAFGSTSFSSHNLPLHIMTQTGESAFVQLKNFPILKPCFTTHRRRFFWQFF